MTTSPVLSAKGALQQQGKEGGINAQHLNCGRRKIFIVAAEILGEITQRSISWGCVVLFCAGQDRGRFFGSPAVAVTAPSAEREEEGGGEL